MATLREQAPTAPLGTSYQYSNLMVAAGGYAAAHAAAPTLGLGDAYDQEMQRAVFAPIAMTRTTFDWEAVAADDHASPHALGLDGVARALPTTSSAAPATSAPPAARGRRCATWRGSPPPRRRAG
jgi:CubicO group peptidase (beta-lactamase class C family)